MPQKKPIRILLVEDEVMTREMVRDYFKELGFQVLQPASTGEAAVEIALKEKPEIILMDIGLAGNMNGIDAAKAITKETPIPVIFITGYDLQDIQKLASSIQPSSFIPKPLIMEHLKKLIYSMLKLDVD